MGENNGDRPMRWDEHARGGAGGWAPATEGGAGLPPDEPGPEGGPDSGPDSGPDTGRRLPPRKYVLLALGGGLAVAAVTLVIAHAVAPSDPETVRSAASSTAADSPSQSPSTSTAADPQPSEPSTGTAEEQATAVDELLERSTSDRQQVIDAVNAIEACASDEAVDNAGQVLDEAAVRRESLITSLAELDLGELASGSRAASSLSAGWQHSADADRAFADWADDAQGCSPGEVPRTSSYHAGVRGSERATGAKEDFVALWTPIAARYALPERDTAHL